MSLGDGGCADDDGGGGDEGIANDDDDAAAHVDVDVALRVVVVVTPTL